MAKIKSAQPPCVKQDTVQHSLQREELTLQQTAPMESRVIARMEPRYPSWPTSKRGPQVTLPPVGMHPANVFRPEQVVEIDYNQQTGEPLAERSLRSIPGSTSLNQPINAQDALAKRKLRF